MISLNLLSPKQKGALESRIVYALLEQLMILIACSALVVTIVLLGVKIELTKRLSDTESRQALSSEYISVNKETSRLNSAVARIAKLETFAQPTTGLLFDIFKRVSSGIQLESVTYDARSATMSISGQADTRENLLAFNEALLGSPYVKTVDNPITNLFKKTEVRFTLQAIINPLGPATTSAVLAPKP